MLTFALTLSAMAADPAVSVHPGLIAFDEPILFVDLGAAAQTQVNTISWSETLPEVDDEVYPGDMWLDLMLDRLNRNLARRSEPMPDDIGAYYPIASWSPAAWTVDAFDTGIANSGIVVSLPAIQAFDEPILFLPIAPTMNKVVRTQPLVIINGVETLDIALSELVHTRRGSASFDEPILFLPDPGELDFLDGPLLRLVDLVSRTVDYTLGEIVAATSYP